MAKKFPRQDVREIDKNPKWYAEHLDFAEDLLRNSDEKTRKMDRMINGYNGVVNPASHKWLTETYGKPNKNKYIDYRIGKSKIDILHGEWLKTPLNSTVRTVDMESMKAKEERQNILMGAAYARKEIATLRENGIDPLEGMALPDPSASDFQDQINPKDRNEIIMQRIVDAVIEELDLIEKFGDNFMDAELVARAFSQIVVNQKTGSIDLEPVDPRDMIAFEFQKDPFYEKSFLMGRREKVPVNEILLKYDLTDAQRQRLEEIRDNFSDYMNRDECKGKYSLLNGQYVVDVIHIEWLGMAPKYKKRSPKTKSQMSFSDRDDGVVELPLNPNYYEYNKNKADKNAKSNKQSIVTEWEEQVYEARRIGHRGSGLDIECRKKPLIARDRDTGRPQLSYTGVIIKPVNGESISIQEVIENFSNLYNIVQYQIVREIGKVKGKAIGYDRIGLPKGEKVTDVLHRLANDSFIDYSSGGSSNTGGKDLPLDRVLREIDLGLSTSFTYLVQFKQDILMSLDIITGINNERVGDIRASSTATNAMSAVEASRTITEALFFYMHKYQEKVLTKIAETAKVVWGLYKPEKLRAILGTEDYQYIMESGGLAEASYKVHLTNGRVEKMIKDDLGMYVDAYANSKELRFLDVMNFKLAKSLTEAKASIEKGWNEVQRIRQAELDKQLMAQNEQSVRQSETQIQLMRENREDTQIHDVVKIKEKGKVDLAVKTATQKGQMIIDQNKLESESEQGFVN